MNPCAASAATRATATTGCAPLPSPTTPRIMLLPRAVQATTGDDAADVVDARRDQQVPQPEAAEKLMASRQRRAGLYHVRTGVDERGEVQP